MYYCRKIGEPKLFFLPDGLKFTQVLMHCCLDSNSAAVSFVCAVNLVAGWGEIRPTDSLLFLFSGRGTTIGIWLSLPQEMTGRRLQRIAWWLIKLLVILQ